MVNLNKILRDIAGADKSMREDMALNAGLLDRKQYNQFVRDMETNQTILKDAAFQRMTNFEEVTSGARILGMVLQDGYDSNGDTNPDLTPANIGFGHDVLNAKKLKALTFIDDDDLEDNIERESFQTTQLSMMADRMGTDTEIIAVFGDSELVIGENDTTPGVLKTMDGWIKRSTNSLESSELASSNSDIAFNVHENTIESMFDAIIRAIPTNIRQSALMSEFRIYAPFEVVDSYRNLLISRETNLGDATLTGQAPLYYKSYPIVYSLVLNSVKGRAIDDTLPTIGAFPSLLKWGVYKDIKVEPERKPDIERTNFWYRMRVACGLRVFSSLITAKLTAAEGAEIQDENKL